MGCFYETCGLSQFPIMPGQKARLFILGRGCSVNDDRAGLCYSTSAWEPLSLPMIGAYDDDHERGSLKHPKFVGGAVTLDVLCSHNLVKTGASFLRELVEGEGSYVADGYGPKNPQPLGQMLILEEVWREALKLSYVRFGREQKTTLVSHLEEAKEWLSFIIKERPDSYESACAIERRYSRKSTLSGFARSLYSELESGLHFNVYRAVIEGKLADNSLTEEAAFEVLTHLAEMHHVSSLMDHLRLAWRPQPGMGSQYTDWELHCSFKTRLYHIADRHDSIEKHGPEDFDEEDLDEVGRAENEEMAEKRGEAMVTTENMDARDATRKFKEVRR
jgi:hypothetical protein